MTDRPATGQASALELDRHPRLRPRTQTPPVANQMKIPAFEHERYGRLLANVVAQGMPAHLADRAVRSWVGILEQGDMLKLLEAMPESAAAFVQYCFLQGYVAGSNHYVATHHQSQHK